MNTKHALILHPQLLSFHTQLTTPDNQLKRRSPRRSSMGTVQVPKNAIPLYIILTLGPVYRRERSLMDQSRASTLLMDIGRGEVSPSCIATCESQERLDKGERGADQF